MDKQIGRYVARRLLGYIKYITVARQICNRHVDK